MSWQSGALPGALACRAGSVATPPARSFRALSERLGGLREVNAATAASLRTIKPAGNAGVGTAATGAAGEATTGVFEGLGFSGRRSGMNSSMQGI